MTETVPLNVKWNKENFKVGFVIANGVKSLKNELEEKTGVPAERMKLMPKSKGLWKGVLKDDADLSKIDFAAALKKEKANELQVLLVGSAEKLKEKPKAPEPPMKEEAKLPPAPPRPATKPAPSSATKGGTNSPMGSAAKKPAPSPAAAKPTGGSNAPISSSEPTRPVHPDERVAYQTTDAWLKQSPPGFLYPRVVPSIVGMRDLVQQPLPPMPQEQEELSLATPKRGKEVLNAALQNLEGLDKEEANLIYASPWTVPLTQIVTQTPAANPQQALQQLQEVGSASPRKVCQYPFKKNDMVVMCRTCQADETCAMCHECYTNSNHEGHDVQFFQAQEGGCCDCGDPEAWDPKGFCPNHGEQAAAPPRRAVCQKPFKKNDMIYMCKTCQADETCAMCHECFQHSNHEGHDVKFYYSQEGGGCCDCGDPDAWAPNGFCPNHGPPKEGESATSQQSPEELLPPGVVTRVRGMVPAIMDWMVNQFVGTAKAAYERTMLPATTAETTLGALGREGHGLYLVVQADDVHQAEYIDSLRQFLGSSSYYDDTVMRKLAQTLVSTGELVIWGTMELATECGRDQTRAWIEQGDPYTSSTIASVLVQRVFDLKRRGLYCRILTLKELQQEQYALAIIQWMAALAFSCDPLCQTVATYIDPQKHLVPLLQADFILSSRFTKAWYALLLNLLSVPAFKSNLGAAYCDTYLKLTEDFAKGKGVLERSAYSLSVQFLNRDTYVLDLVANRDLLSKLGKALLATLKAAEDHARKCLNPNHVVLSNRRYQPCVSDLNYVINVKGMKRLITCTGATFMKDFVAGLSLAQCMDTHSWRHFDLGHVEEEDLGWYNAFNLSLTLGGLFERLLSFDDDDASPVQDPSSPYSSGLLTCAELSYQVLVTGLQSWQKSAMKSMKPTPFSSAVDAHRRRSATLPYSTIAAKHGTNKAFRQMPVSQVSPFSLHLPLHRFFASCVRELSLRPDERGTRCLLERLQKELSTSEMEDLFHGLIQFPVFALSRAAQVRAGLWRRNGPGLNEQVIKYADPAYCRSMRDSDLALVQLAVVSRSLRMASNQPPNGTTNSEVDVAAFVHLLLHRLGLFEFVGLSKAPDADPDAYEAELSKGLYPAETGEDNGGKSGVVFPWTYTPARDAADCRALVEEFLYFLIVFATELPRPPPRDTNDHTNQAKAKLRREVIHRLAASPRTHSELADVYLVLSYREHMLLNEVGKSINPDDATAAMLGQILSDVAERKASRSRLEPDKFVLLKSAWDTYDPSFFHLSVEGHQTAAESRPVPSDKDEVGKGLFGPRMPFAPSLPKAHPSFARLRRDISADATVLTVAYRILHMHCRGSQRSDLEDLQVGRLAYDNGAKSEISLARALHLLTLGCFAWEGATNDDDNWHVDGGGSTGSIFHGRKSSPTTKDWIGGALLADPKDLMDCPWYEGEENTLLLLKRLATDGGASGVFVVQDPAVQAGAAWICEFAVKHCPDAAKSLGKGNESGNVVEKNESELERRKRIAKEKALSKINQSAARFADMMQIELKENDDDGGLQEESDSDRRKREAKERALAKINEEAEKFAASMGIEIKKKGKGNEKKEEAESTEETDFERRKREAKERALARINQSATKFAEFMNIELKNKKTDADDSKPAASASTNETDFERRKREAKEKALAKINQSAAKFAGFMDIELQTKETDVDDLKGAASGSTKTQNLRKERPQCIICSDSDAECFVAFSQGSTVLKGGGGPSVTGDTRMTHVRKHAGTYIALCGHAVHSDCAASYLAKVQANEDQASSSLSEFRCPLCQRPSNCLVPYIDVSVNWIDSPTCVPATPKDSEASDFNKFLTTTPWWVARRQKDVLWDGQSSFTVASADSKDQVEADAQISGEVMVFKTLMEHLCGIAYETDSKRLGDEKLQSDVGEFRHYVLERHVYQISENRPNAWPACLFPDQLPEDKTLSFTREKFIAQLLMSIQTLVYSCSCEIFDARRNIVDLTSSTNGKAAASDTDALKPAFSKFGINDAICEGQLILMPTPSSTKDEGSQPFHGRFGRLRNYCLAIMAAAGAVGPDLTQVVLQLPTSTATPEPGMPQRAPIAYPLLLGHVLTHTVAAICTCCGVSIAPQEWKKSLGGAVSCSSTGIDGLADDCDGFLKLGFLARVLQVLCRELGVTYENASEIETTFNNLQDPDYASCSDQEREWVHSCLTLWRAAVAKSQPVGNQSSPAQGGLAAKFQAACMVAAGAAAAYLADTGTILQVLVPGVMSRYSSSSESLNGSDEISSLNRLQNLRDVFAFESIDKMMESASAVEVVCGWFDDACKYMTAAAGASKSETAKRQQLLPPQNFRAWDWPLESVKDYPLSVTSREPVATRTSKKPAPLLGGYNSDVQPADCANRPCIDALPPSYMELYAKIGALKPDAERTAVCLCCGEALDAAGNGACTSHSYECGGGTGLFFLLQDCVGLILHRGEGSFIHSIYVDSHGETPRGRPLYLDLARYNHLRDIYMSHQVRQQVLAERESTQQGVLTGYY